MMKEPTMMKSCEVNKFFKISSHVRREKCATLCMVESTLIDPISYLSSRCCVCEKQCYVKDCLTLQELILPSTAVL